MGCLYYNNISRILPHGWYLTTEMLNPDGHGAINSIMWRSSHIHFYRHSHLWNWQSLWLRLWSK